MTMDEQLARIIRKMIATERSRRSIPTSDSLNEIKEDFTKRGALGQGRYPVMLDTQAAQEYEHRADQWLRIICRAMADSEFSWTYERAQRMDHILRTELVTDWEDLIERLRVKATQHKPRIDELERAKDRAFARYNSEMELLVLSQDRNRIPVGEQLTATRYAAVHESWKKARSFLDSDAGDKANAAKEAVSAVEQLARIVIGDETKTLGGAIKILRESGRIQAPLLKGLEEIWGWTSSVPGVRHGAGLDTAELPTARYIVELSEAALRLLVASDAA